MKCPRCEAEVEGRFCGLCGAVLGTRRCPACETHVPAGHRFCSECGAEQSADVAAVRVPIESGAGAGARRHGTQAIAGAPAAAGGGRNRTGWWVAGGFAVATAAILLVPSLWSDWRETGASGERFQMSAPGGGPGMAPQIDLSSMTPREAADRLFDRVMRAMAADDDEQVRDFLPMALDAYALAEPLDADGHFHVSLLLRASGRHAEALETAEGVLETEPNHLLHRYAAGESAAALGRDETAQVHFRHLLDVFEEESVRGLPEYEEHASFLPVIREVARDFLASNGS